jgi:hypothetical protein
MKNTLILLVLASCTSSTSTHENSPVEQHRDTAMACPASAGDSNGPDECLVDTDCLSGAACACAGTTFENYGSETRNVCVTAGCHVDADCGSAGLCSPSNGGCGHTFYGVVDFECRTSNDTCGADEDCVHGGQQGSCSFSPEVGYWACTFFAGCAG